MIMLRKILTIVFLLSSIVLKSQYKYSVSTQGCEFDISMKIRTDSQSRENQLLINLEVFNLDTVVKYFPIIASDKSRLNENLLFTLSERFYQNKILELYFGTCNEHNFPVFYCRSDSLNLIPIFPNKKIDCVYEIPLKFSPYEFAQQFEIDIFIRFISTVPANIGDSLFTKKISLRDYISNSVISFIKLNKERAIDATSP